MVIDTNQPRAPHSNWLWVRNFDRPFDFRQGVVIGAGAYALVGGMVTLLGWALNIPRLTDWAAVGRRVSGRHQSMDTA